jgi:hypothetical protein
LPKRESTPNLIKVKPVQLEEVNKGHGLFSWVMDTSEWENGRGQEVKGNYDEEIVETPNY